MLGTMAKGYKISAIAVCAVISILYLFHITTDFNASPYMTPLGSLFMIVWGIQLFQETGIKSLASLVIILGTIILINFLTGVIYA
ncbi:hypothetical protein K8O68_15270 [Salipaludibacillus sp. CUR1]|uniref:hypothetical protein n=1 Tax=Salipaludibacillus sp. CUR1 TaxID=2820003 RepID=UPI001E485F70|nr:hypothetical protein [Salipaludibacillus sp. CUR1]MCE7793783.1 hypothetical protein [Salipaludibacillus sp. CUR1]